MGAGRRPRPRRVAYCRYDRAGAPARAVELVGIDGLEFIEYATSQPQALGSVLQKIGFEPLRGIRSREVMLYRQGR